MGSVKYEYLYLQEHSDGRQLERGLGAYLRFYNEERPHQALEYRTPREVYGNWPRPLSPQGGGRAGGTTRTYPQDTRTHKKTNQQTNPQTGLEPPSKNC